MEGSKSLKGNEENKKEEDEQIFEHGSWGAKTKKSYGIQKKNIGIRAPWKAEGSTSIYELKDLFDHE